MNMEDYAMILGMPGTGKTTLVSLLVQGFLKLGRRVLVASFTNSAVDNMLVTYKNDRFCSNRTVETFIKTLGPYS